MEPSPIDVPDSSSHDSKNSDRNGQAFKANHNRDDPHILEAGLNDAISPESISQAILSPVGQRLIRAFHVATDKADFEDYQKQDFLLEFYKSVGAPKQFEVEDFNHKVRKRTIQLKVDKEAKERLEASKVKEDQATTSVIDGGDWILDQPEDIPSVWGAGDLVLWSQGEPCLLAGQQGLGKTTLAQQLVLHLIGVRTGSFLGLPVLPLVSGEKVLYLAMDRPRQAARSFRRMVGNRDRELLKDGLVVWKGPLPFAVTPDSAKDLGKWIAAEFAGIRVVIVDSLKDMAPGLASDEIGSAVNIAFQSVVSRDIELLILHHERKAAQGEKRHSSIDDVYGSTFITSGCGSVLALEGEPGDLDVGLKHLKQPAECVTCLEDFVIQHDHYNGVSIRSGYVRPKPQDAIWERIQSGRATTTELAVAGYGNKPADKDIKATKRLLGRWEREGRLVRSEGTTTAKGRSPDCWSVATFLAKPSDKASGQGVLEEPADKPADTEVL